ncbi:MAG: PTS transporter subunit EIIC [Bacillota bacterium]
MKVRAFFQKFGGAAMTPIAVLPAAALIIALGTVLPHQWVVARGFAAAGQVLLEYLGLIFAIGLAVGFCNREGVAGLAAAMGYLIINGIARTMNPEVNIGVLAGIVAGVIAALLFQRFHRVRFPDYFSFFGGQRFVPIITSFAAVLVGLAMGLIGPYLATGLQTIGDWMAGAGALGVGVYGALERLLIPTGLHHFLNGLILLLLGEYGGATGDLGRFFAGDPTAGYFMGGAFAIKVFALPAACLALYHEARAGGRKAVKGLMITAAATSFLTGITEPVEFAFLFTAPILFLFHAVLTGSSFVLNYLLEIRHGFASSAGAFEFLVNLGQAERGLWIIPIGLGYAAIYYFGFRLLIRRLDLATPGRHAEEAGLDAAEERMRDLPLAERAREIVAALGGTGNLGSVDSCLTRLRMVLEDESRVNEARLRELGAAGIVKLGPGVWQVVFGTVSDALRHEIKGLLKTDED